MNFDRLKEQLERCNSLYVVMRNRPIDMSTGYTYKDTFVQDVLSKKEAAVHWSKDVPTKDTYLPATFLRQLLTLDYYDVDTDVKPQTFQPEVIIQPYSHLVDNKGLENHETWIEKLQTYFKRDESANQQEVSHNEQDDVNKRSFEMAMLMFTQENYTACRSFETLKDTFQMEIPPKSLVAIHRKLYTDTRSVMPKKFARFSTTEVQNKPDIPQGVVDDNRYSLRLFHHSLLQCLFRHYILGFSRVLFFLAFFNEYNDVKENKGYIKLLQRAIECVKYHKGKRGLCLNHYNRQNSSFCNEDVCKNIAKFRVNGGELQPFFEEHKKIEFRKDGNVDNNLILPTLESILVTSENGLLYVRWNLKENSLKKLISKIVQITTTNAIRPEISSRFPRTKQNLLNFVSEVGRPTSIAKDEVEGFFARWPIYEIISCTTDPYEKKSYGQIEKDRKKAKDILNGLFEGENTESEKGYQLRLLNMIISGMWSSALESLTEKMFVSEGSTTTITIHGIRAFLELSCLASKYLVYRETDNTLKKPPEITGNFGNVGIGFEGNEHVGPTMTYLDDIIKTLNSASGLDDFFGMIDPSGSFSGTGRRENGGIIRWLYYPLGGTKSQRRKFRKSDDELTKVQGFILFIAVLLQKGNNTGNPVLGRLSASILFEDDQ